MGMAVAGVYSQDLFRFRNDNGTQTSATFSAALNANVVQGPSVFRLRIYIEQASPGMTGDPPKTFKLRFSRNAGAYTDVGPKGGAEAARFATSAHVTHGTPTTRILSWGYVGGWVTGQIADTNTLNALQFPEEAWAGTELEFVLELNADVALTGDTFAFRVYDSTDTAIDRYNHTPVATAAFAVNGSMSVQEPNTDNAILVGPAPVVSDITTVGDGSGTVTLGWVSTPNYVNP